MAELPDRIAEQRKLIAEQIASDMETKGFAWKRPWMNAAMPHNPVTGTHYRGGNHVHLAAIATIRGYNDPRWVTFNQAKQLGWKMRKGAKSAAIEKWKTYVVESDKEDDEGNPIMHSFLRCVGYWSVFNASCFENVPPMEKMEPNSDLEVGQLADEVIQSSRCPVVECATDNACYYPLSDKIEVPDREAFSSNSAFLVTLLHEMGHSTGHPSDQNRQLTGSFGSQSYAFEELIAELSSVFSSAELGIDSEPDENSEHYQQHIAYLKSWTSALREDPDIIFKAASSAEKATDSIISRYEAHTGHLAPGKELISRSMKKSPENGSQSLDKKSQELKDSTPEVEALSISPQLKEER